MKGFFSKCDQIRSFLWNWSYLLMKPLMENIFCAVTRMSIVKTKIFKAHFLLSDISLFT